MAPKFAFSWYDPFIMDGNLFYFSVSWLYLLDSYLERHSTESAMLQWPSSIQASLSDTAIVKHNQLVRAELPSVHGQTEHVCTFQCCSEYRYRSTFESSLSSKTHSWLCESKVMSQGARGRVRVSAGFRQPSVPESTMKSWTEGNLHRWIWYNTR